MRKGQQDNQPVFDLDQSEVPEPVAPALSIMYGRYCVGHDPGLL